MALRPDPLEVSPRDKAVSAAVRAGVCAEGDPATEIHPDVAPRPGDVGMGRSRRTVTAGRGATSGWIRGASAAQQPGPSGPIEGHANETRAIAVAARAA